MRLWIQGTRNCILEVSSVRWAYDKKTGAAIVVTVADGIGTSYTLWIKKNPNSATDSTYKTREYIMSQIFNNGMITLSDCEILEHKTGNGEYL